jgi:predicted Zn-dependent protease with MMP-like domain
MKLTEKEVQRILEESIRALPREFRRALDNVVISVEDAPPAGRPHRRPIRYGRILLGLYHGVPRTKRSGHFGPLMPDSITLYKTSIEKIAGTREEAGKLLRTTLLHEIGHHLGLSEEDLESAGY